jgi:3-oxoacyl-[acyl-carrier protein] reductase
MSELAGKVAVVTGASKGIGAGIARALAAEGAAVVVNYAATRTGAEQTVREITERGGRARAIQADISRGEDIERLFALTLEAFGRVDILVNNAAVYQFAPLEGVTEAEFHRQFNLNVLGLILATREAARYFGPQGGSVINIGSVASTLAPPNSVVYTATKGAVDAVTRVLAKELGARKIRVNSINPGYTVTEGTQEAGIVGSPFADQMVASTALGRAGAPEDIAPVAVFLASGRSGWLTGETVAVSGGQG